MSKPVSTADSQSEIKYRSTRMESVEEIRQLNRGENSTALSKEQEEAEIPAFRPVHRPPLALLCILDDGKEDGEWIRIRTPRLVIGRTEGDVVIPFDEMLSSRHAELVCVPKAGGHRWILHDLESTNGMFIRSSQALLSDGQEFIIGRTRFRFTGATDSNGSADKANDNAVGKPLTTRGWQTMPPSAGIPMLVELTTRGEGERHLLTKPETWIGSDSKACSIVLAMDPLVSPKHARLSRDSQGKWLLENAKSRNGLWIRISKIPITGSGQFQLGEQRFLIRVQH